MLSNYDLWWKFAILWGRLKQVYWPLPPARGGVFIDCIVIRYHLSPYGKTYFCTLEWFWHTKHHLVNFQMKWIFWGSPLFWQITHLPGWYSWKYPFRETGESGELQLNHVKEKHHHRAVSQHSSFSLLWQYINFFGVYHKISISSSTCPFTFLSLSSSTSTFTSTTHLDNHLRLNDHLCCHVHHFRQLMHFASTLWSTFSSISSSINTYSIIPSIIFKPCPLSYHTNHLRPFQLLEYQIGEDAG